MKHLTIRVAWHDSRWNGTICLKPSENSFCVGLDRIRATKDDRREDQFAGRNWDELQQDQLPPCIAESAGFMNPGPWHRVFEHPYHDNAKAAATHGCLAPTSIKVPPYSTFAVPFWWMLSEHQRGIEESLPKALPRDEKAPFATPWVFGRDRQEALLELMFHQLQKHRSLVFFYSKEGTPLGDTHPRLIVGLGTIAEVSPILRYESSQSVTYPLWDRVISHSIRSDGHEGFLIPYHDYFAPTGDPVEDERRVSLVEEIAVGVLQQHADDFKYAAELASPDAALSTLIRCLEILRKIREHGIAKGPWERREEWLNQQIADSWKDRGAFPGLGSTLEAFGMRLGTTLVQELVTGKTLDPDENPWPKVDALIRGQIEPPHSSYKGDLAAVRKSWIQLPSQRRTLLELLARFDLSPAQAKRWFDPITRGKDSEVTVSDLDILNNPYRMSETDMGSEEDSPVLIGCIDRGLLPDSTVASRHPVPTPSAVMSQLDARRVRAAFTEILREAANAGDCLLSVEEAVMRLQSLGLTHPCNPSFDWINANSSFLSETAELLSLSVGIDPPHEVMALQLSALKEREDRLRRILRARGERPLEILTVDWQKLLLQSIEESEGRYDSQDNRHVAALKEQVSALDRITKRKLSVLVGRAGTGKTSVLGALRLCSALEKGGILFLAPTGKARVRLGRAANAEAMTIAQFLYRLDRYDGKRQRPLFSGEKYKKERTVVIDECSMLTLDDLAAVLDALDLGHVERLILVGDPNQLPPIGAGRPFADLVTSLEMAADAADTNAQKFSECLARLTVEVRTTAGTPSDTLRLASWFTREPQLPDADRVLSDLERGIPFNDLEVVFWKSAEDLRSQLIEQFEKHLALASADDVVGFNKSLGFGTDNRMSFDSPNGVENFQILSPVRMHPHGVHELNRWIQLRFRGNEIRNARIARGFSLGGEEIVVRDKVIQIWNERRNAYDGKQSVKLDLANGEIGTACYSNNGFMNVVFAGRPNYTVGYRSKDFPGGSGPLELAYALTVHKSQGSEFRRVFVVLPKNCRLLTRELIYTALTRSRDQMVLLIEGDSASVLYEFTKPERSETARRNTNLFQPAVRGSEQTFPYAEGLIHQTEKGHMVRSKSELVITTVLYRDKIDYEYERPLSGSRVPGTMRPDFSFVDPAGDVIIWEHLGMLARDDYRNAWEWKRDWYDKNGYVLGKNLFTTEDDLRGGLDANKVRETADTIRKLI